MRALVLLLMSLPLGAAPVVLYDAAGASAPGSQGWVLGAVGTPVETLLPGAVSLDTTSNSTIQAGYTRTAPFALELATGFTLRFDVRVAAESHSRPERAGFSVLLLSSSLQGIELGFWADTIFAQNAGFLTTGESTAFDTTAAITRYELTMLGSAYTLYGNGVALLAGSLRDYSAHPFPVYSVPNVMFLGDDTTSAAGRFEWAYADLTAIPEPSTAWFVVLGAVGIGIGAYRRTQR